MLWWVFFTIACILTLIYTIGLYFTYFDDPKEFERTFNNEKRMKYGGLSKRDIQGAQMINKNIKEKFQAPMESSAFREAKAKKLRKEEAHMD